MYIIQHHPCIQPGRDVQGSKHLSNLGAQSCATPFCALSQFTISPTLGRFYSYLHLAEGEIDSKSHKKQQSCNCNLTPSYRLHSPLRAALSHSRACPGQVVRLCMLQELHLLQGCAWVGMKRRTGKKNAYHVTLNLSSLIKLEHLEYTLSR